MVVNHEVEGPGGNEQGGYSVLRIPFDGPDIEGKRAVVCTTLGMFKGIVMRFDRDGLDLAVNGQVKQFDGQDVQSIIAA